MASLLRLTTLLLSAAVVLSNAGPVQRPLGSNEDDTDDTPLPLVIWHGLGDNYASDGLKQVGAIAEAVNPGTFVYYVQLGEDASQDGSASFIGNLVEQIDQVCADLAEHPILSTAPAIDALGFSQGGQFLRAYVQRCNYPPVRNLVTFGSQHNGISAFRECGDDEWLCKAAMTLLLWNVWSSFVQNRLVPAQYYRNPDEFDDYLTSSNFLADINNERALKNTTYKENLSRLENLVLYKFENDTKVIPKESAWFEEVNGTEVTPLRARKLYSEDWLGLRELDRKGGLKFRTTPGEHMELSEEVLNETFKEFYGPLKKSKSFAQTEPSEL